MTKSPTPFEVNFDGLVGPTHNYSGLSQGNLASTSNKATVSNPRAAALQGLAKARKLMEMGVKQGVIPPQERPYLPGLRALGWSGTDEVILEKVAREQPELLPTFCSASSMWTANSCTVSPSSDTRDGRVHFTPANLISKPHRAIETATTARILKKIFADPAHFTHHPPLPSEPRFGDEGAANHTRFCSEYGSKGVEFFVYGRRAAGGSREPRRFQARQTQEASISISQAHLLDPRSVVLAQQSPEAIDAGVFHNDVAGVGNRHLYFYHEESFLDAPSVLQELSEKFKVTTGEELRLLEVPSAQVSLEDAVRSYLFNGQLLTLPNGKTALILPTDCQSIPSVANYLDSLSKDGAISEIHYFDLKQSMRNGGGPACLRLRVVLTPAELKATQNGVLLTPALVTQLEGWITRNYREELDLQDLHDPALLRESRAALDELTRILHLGSVYDFQK